MLYDLHIQCYSLSFTLPILCGNSATQYGVVILALSGILKKPREESVSHICSCLNLPTFLLFLLPFFVFYMVLFPFSLATSSRSFYFTFIPPPPPPLLKDVLAGYVILGM